jgi:FkbM family methyltransferase
MSLLTALGRYRLTRRLVTSLRKRIAQLTRPSGYRVVQANGVYFLTNWRNFIDRQVDFFGDYEWEQVAFLIDRLAADRCTVFADIGANFGYYAAQIAQRFPNMRVLAFEPDPRSMAQLHANLLINSLIGRVETHAVAATAVAGDLPFHAYPDSSTGQSRVDAAATGSVVGVRLDDVLACGTERLAVKIDIEGHELEALQGMPRLLARNAVLIQVESFPVRATALEALLRGAGFSPIRRIGDDYFFVKS